MKLDRFYPIFDNLGWLERTLPLGVKLVQLRMKDLPEAELRPLVARAEALCRTHGATLVAVSYTHLTLPTICSV